MTKQRGTKKANRQMQSISVPLDQGYEVLYLLNFQDDEWTSLMEMGLPKFLDYQRYMQTK